MRVNEDSTDVSVDIRAFDVSGSTLQTKVAANFTLWYRRGTDGAKESISLIDLSALTDAHSDGGIIHVDDGWYRVDIPDAAFASGVPFVLVGGTVSGGVVLSNPVSIVSETVTSVTLPDDPTLATGVMKLLTPAGAADEGATVTVKVVGGPGTAGYSLDDTVWTETADSNGDVQFVGLLPGATYEIWRGNSKRLKQQFTVDTDAGGTSFNIEEVIGKP